MYMIIAGLGGIGRSLARIATAKGNNVSVIDIDEKKCATVLENYDLRAVVGNATETTTLEEAGISQADTLIASTGDDSVNLMLCWMARSFEVKTIVAVVNYREHEQMFRDGGFRICENRNDLAARNLILSLTNPGAQIIVAFEGGCIFEIVVKDGSKGADKQIKDLPKAKDELYVSIRRNNELIVPNGDTVIKAGDVIAVFTKKEAEERSVARMNDIFSMP